MNRLKKTIIALALTGAVTGAAIDATTVSDSEFDVMVPTVSIGSPITKDVTKYALGQKESLFVARILEGKGPTGQGTDSIENVQALYLSAAKKMGLTPQDILQGVNLYDFIRK